MKAIDMKLPIKILVAGLLACSCSCNKNVPQGGGENGGQDGHEAVQADASAYVTTADGSKLFSSEGIAFGEPSNLCFAKLIVFTLRKREISDRISLFF